MMDVFLIPAGGSRYHLYCEIGDGAVVASGEEHRGWRRRAVDRFTSIVDHVDRARHGAAYRRSIHAPRSLRRRVSDRIVCWLAEKIAEQRLLWHLHRQTEVKAWFPSDITESEAREHINHILSDDARRHGRWAIVHGAGAAGSLLLVPLPGPNLLGYYFTFRLVGHWLSRTGARHGLNAVKWVPEPDPLLTELREALALEPDSRRARIAEIASRLRLEHLATFVERLAVAAS